MSLETIQDSNWFKLIVERVPSALLVADRKRRIRLVNQNLELLFGYSRAELIGQPLELLVPSRFRSQHPGYVSDFFTVPKARAMGAGRDLFAMRKDGVEIPVEIGLNPIETQAGLFTLASIIDITERKKADERFRLVVEAAPDAMLMADKNRRITLVNRNAEALFGYSRVELIGESLEILVPDRFRARHPGHVSNFFSDPKMRAMGAGRDLYARRKDGTEVPVEIGLNPIETSVDPFILASIVDISVRKRAEELEQRMSALIESAEDAIVTKSLDGNILTWNPGAERLLGYRAAEIIGQPVTRLIPQERQAEESMILGRINRGQPVEHFETVRCRKDGSHVHVSLTISPIYDRSGSIVGASKIMRNITQRKREEEKLRHSNENLEKLNEELDEFVYTASHDLRAPLNGVSTVVQWILEDDALLSTESRERLMLIRGRIERMKRLLNDIRDYARLGGFAETSGGRISAASLVSDVATTIHVPPGFSIRCDASLEAIEVDRVPLEQVLHNLVNNAIKHHDRSTGTVTVSVESNSSRLRFFVLDDGPGIPELYREDIFGMFKTLKPRDQVDGSGIGLSLVRKIVGRMGGKCGIEPVGDRGARFWFEWPHVRGTK